MIRRVSRGFEGYMWLYVVTRGFEAIRGDSMVRGCSGDRKVLPVA